MIKEWYYWINIEQFNSIIKTVEIPFRIWSWIVISLGKWNYSAFEIINLRWIRKVLKLHCIFLRTNMSLEDQINLYDEKPLYSKGKDIDIYLYIDRLIPSCTQIHCQWMWQIIHARVNCPGYIFKNVFNMACISSYE